MDRRSFLGRVGSLSVAVTLTGCAGDDPDESTTAASDDRTRGASPAGPTGDTTSTATDETTATGTETATPDPTPPPGEYRNPVYEPVLADPSVVRTDDGTVYAYGTETDYRDDSGPMLIPILRSRNLVDWTAVGDAFETRPDWKDEGGLWAPDIARYDGRYYLFYAHSTWGDPNPGIGVATADHPEGPFTDRGELIRSESIGVENSIDPAFVVADGTPYLFWGSFHGIYGIELTGDALGHVGADAKFRVAGDSFEAPYVLRRDGSYYLFLSGGSCCEGTLSSYYVVAGRADALEGPYRNAAGESLLDKPGTLVVESGNGFVGPGHNCVLSDDEGAYWTLYHAYEEGESYVGDDVGGELRRTLMLDPLAWTDDGFPIIEDRVPGTGGEVPVLNDSTE